LPLLMQRTGLASLGLGRQQQGRSKRQEEAAVAVRMKLLLCATYMRDRKLQQPLAMADTRDKEHEPKAYLHGSQATLKSTQKGKKTDMHGLEEKGGPMRIASSH
jgi:hypothetical protein